MRALTSHLRQPRRGKAQRPLGRCEGCGNLVYKEQAHVRSGSVLRPFRRYTHAECVAGRSDRGQEPQPGFLGRMEVK